MSESFRYIREFPEFSERLAAEIIGGGNYVRLTAADKWGKEPWRRSTIDLPASDARRLRDWLNERYPDEEKG